MNKHKIPLTLLILFILFGFTKFQSVKTKQVSLDFTSKILEKGKYIAVSGEMYYSIPDKRMTTHLTIPFENITIANANGEMKIYDAKENTVMYSTSEANSTESSYFHHFFNSSTSDMGLQKLGYTIFNTKIDDGMLVTSWMPKQNNTPIKRIVLAHMKSNIMYMEIVSGKNKPMGKVFFSKHSKVGEFTIPLSITEFSYSDNGDSVVTKKVYSNPKVNELVNSKYINYQVPKNAKVVKVNK